MGLTHQTSVEFTLQPRFFCRRVRTTYETKIGKLELLHWQETEQIILTRGQNVFQHSKNSQISTPNVRLITFPTQLYA